MAASSMFSCCILVCLMMSGVQGFLAPGGLQGLATPALRVPRSAHRAASSSNLVMVEPSDRRAVIGHSVKLAASVLVSSKFPHFVMAEESVAAADKLYENSKSGFQLAYPASWKESKKPVQTHQDEIQFKSTTTKGTEVGVTVDPVKIDSVAQFGTPKEVGKRVMGVERAKDGVLSAKLLGTSSAEYDGVPYYTIEYESESTRGNKHFIACVAINNKKLYVVTGQGKQDTFNIEQDNIRRSVASFRLTRPS